MKSKSIVNVRYAETDKMGIVHHSVYPIWLNLQGQIYLNLQVFHIQNGRSTEL